MFFGTFVFIFFASSPVFMAVVKEEENMCSVDEFACGDGGCVSLDRLCDGLPHCADGSDEHACSGILGHTPFRQTILTRSKRQAGRCRKNEWKCRNGQCIRFDGKCDGVVNCQDKSDETHALCRKSQCQSNWFRCTYGACVDGTAPCNGIQECADNSDELLPRCRNETEEVRGRFKCDNGDMISAAEHCDGVVHCADGSDETVRSCASKTCPSYLFQCAYGACVDQGADCNGIKECADGSDESDELCNRIGTGTVVTPSTGSGGCVLPPYPEHGKYVVGGVPNASPGQAFESYQLNVTCSPGYGVVGSDSLLCVAGFLMGTLPECVRFCQLSPHPSVEYFCEVNTNSVTGTRPCGAQEPSGTVVTPKCRAPNYYYAGVLNKMTCIDGNWDYVAMCNPECGRLTPGATPLVVNGTYAKQGELPWHTGIYRKTSTPYMQICGGSLLTTTVVISAAHCFWSEVEGQLPTANYAIAVGKLYRHWNSPRDLNAQKSDVSDIKIPKRYQGAKANYQEDLALLILTTVIEYKTYVRPVCIDFDIEYEERQLKSGNMGKIAGWGLTGEDGDSSLELLSVELPYVEIDDCIARSPPKFREYISGDKMCAGYTNGTAALCKGDSGGGLVFPAVERGVTRHYLRGLVSTAAPDDVHKCNVNTLTAFTQISKHEAFIKRYVRLGF